MTKSLRGAAVGLMTATALTASADDLPSWMPTVGAALRGRYELDTDSGEGRFQLRNARLRLRGEVNKSMGYYMQLDLCNNSASGNTVKLLDAYIRLKPTQDWYVDAGQGIVPFSVEAFKAPGTYYFVNRSTVGKYIGTQRSVGVKAAYTPKDVPVFVEAGVFNASPLDKTQIWSKQYTAGVRARYTFAGVLTGELGYKTDVPPGGVRSHFGSGAVTLRNGRWFVEGEYVMRRYADRQFDDAQAYVLQAQYSMPVEWGAFNRLSFGARFDGMTDMSDGKLYKDAAKPEAAPTLVANNPAFERITAGPTLSWYKGTQHVDLRLNYEHYWFDKQTAAPVGGPTNLASAELIIYF